VRKEEWQEEEGREGSAEAEVEPLGVAHLARVGLGLGLGLDLGEGEPSAWRTCDTYGLQAACARHKGLQAACIELPGVFWRAGLCSPWLHFDGYIYYEGGAWAGTAKSPLLHLHLLWGGARARLYHYTILTVEAAHGQGDAPGKGFLPWSWFHAGVA
jgi:hypothetical protein